MIESEGFELQPEFGRRHRRRHQQRACRTNLVLEADADVGLDQQLGDLAPLERGADVQRRVAVLVLLVDAALGRDEDARHAGVAVARRCVQRRIAVLQQTACVAVTSTLHNEHYAPITGQAPPHPRFTTSTV